MNDLNWLLLILFIFVGVGVILPYINDSFGTSASEVNTNVLTSDVSASEVGLGTVLLSVVKIASWSFGDLPFFLELIIFVPLRIIFYTLLWRQLRSGGG